MSERTAGFLPDFTELSLRRHAFWPWCNHAMLVGTAAPYGVRAKTPQMTPGHKDRARGLHRNKRAPKGGFGADDRADPTARNA